MWRLPYEKKMHTKSSKASQKFESGQWLYGNFMHTKGQRSPTYGNLVHTEYYGFTVVCWWLNLHALVPLGHVRRRVSRVATAFHGGSTVPTFHFFVVHESRTFLRPLKSQSATIMPILHISVASALSNSSLISAAEARVAALELLPVILTWRQQQWKELKHSKNHSIESIFKVTGASTRYRQDRSGKKDRDIVENLVSWL